MALLDNVVEVLNLTHKNPRAAAGVDRIDGRLVRPALVDRDLVRIALRSHGLVKEALRRGHVALGDSATEILPHAFYLDTRLILRQLQPTRRLCLRAIFSISGRKRTAQRLMDEWSTATPHSSINSSM
jgi:hypothetical protein